MLLNIEWSLAFTIVGIILQSLAVLLGLKRLFKPEYDLRQRDDKNKEERRDDILMLVLVFTGMFLQIIGVILDFIK